MAGFLGAAGAGLLALALGVVGLAPAGPAQAQPGLGEAPQPTIGPDIPSDVEIPQGFPGNPIAFFDDFSWRSFVALSWPADISDDRRGVPNRTSTIGDLSAPTVWDTWKADFELFQPQGAPPSEWDSHDAVSPCQAQGWTTPTNIHQDKILAQFSKIGGLSQAGFSGAQGSALAARNSSYVRYEVRVNRLEHDFIRDRKLYLAANLPGPTTPPLSFTTNSIEVKGAWREAHDDELPAMQGRYYIVKAQVMNPVRGVCEEKNMALVGLHIVQKTPSRPQWIWSSFEHVDNVPERGGALDHAFSFNDGDPTKQQLTPAVAPPPLSPTNLPQESPTPMQVVRRSPIAASTLATNSKYQEALRGTVWENYKLVMTQWPTNTALPAGAPFPSAQQPQPPTSTANTTMETYFQQPAASCMRCHDTARANKLDFVWFVPLRAFSPTPPTHLLAAHAAAPTPREKALKELAKMITESQQ